MLKYTTPMNALSYIILFKHTYEIDSCYVKNMLFFVFIIIYALLLGDNPRYQYFFIVNLFALNYTIFKSKI